MITRCWAFRRGHNLVLSQALKTAVSQVPSNRYGSSSRPSMRASINEVRGRPCAGLSGYTHSAAPSTGQTHIHRCRQVVCRGAGTARADGGTVFVEAGRAHGTPVFFLWVTASFRSAFQIQYRETWKCRARSACVRSGCSAT